MCHKCMHEGYLCVLCVCPSIGRRVIQTQAKPLIIDFGRVGLKMELVSGDSIEMAEEDIIADVCGGASN